MTLVSEFNRPAQNDTAKTTTGTVTIGGSSATVVAANPGRVEITIVNDHATQIAYLSLGGTAVVGSGIRLNAAGGSYTTNAYTGAINGIATGAGTVLTFTQI
jgi:hypothetical protein